MRDHAHENVFAKALESLGVQWNKVLPVPKFDATEYPEVKELMDNGLHLKQHHFRVDGSLLGTIFKGAAPAADGKCVTSDELPEGAPIPVGPERPEEYSPGLPSDLAEKAEALSKLAKG